tara:strand:- start:491 stop:1006 length:516 start_codon:yes stop_codon:yes gene_type:complete
MTKKSLAKVQNIPSIKIPIIFNDQSSTKILSEITNKKKIIIFGVPGSFTPTCSEKHLPGYIELFFKFKNLGIDDIYCLSVNDAYVLKAWLKSFSNGNLIRGIADGNCEFTNIMKLSADYSKNFMGKRCKRFALIATNNVVDKVYIEKEGNFLVSSANYVLKDFKTNLEKKY